MLQFEQTEGNDAGMRRGYVVLPIAEYERLMAVRRMVRLEEHPWGEGTLELELDKRQLYAIGMEMLKASYTDDELAQYDIAAGPDKLNVLDVRLASKKKQEE